MRKIEDEREARAFLKAAKSAGVPLKAWARARGIDGRSLNAWRINLARRGTDRTATTPWTRSAGAMVLRPRRALVELVPAAPTTTAPRYAVHVGGLQVEVGDDFDPVTLRRLVEVLRAC